MKKVFPNRGYILQFLWSFAQISLNFFHSKYNNIYTNYLWLLSSYEVMWLNVPIMKKKHEKIDPAKFLQKSRSFLLNRSGVQMMWSNITARTSCAPHPLSDKRVPTENQLKELFFYNSSVNYFKIFDGRFKSVFWFTEEFYSLLQSINKC